MRNTERNTVSNNDKDALAYNKNYILKEAIIKKADKAESAKNYNYPHAAAQELLSNVVYHNTL